MMLYSMNISNGNGTGELLKNQNQYMKSRPFCRICALLHEKTKVYYSYWLNMLCQLLFTKDLFPQQTVKPETDVSFESIMIGSLKHSNKIFLSLIFFVLVYHTMKSFFVQTLRNKPYFMLTDDQINMIIKYKVKGNENLTIWPENVGKHEDRILNQLNYKPESIYGVKKISIWSPESSSKIDTKFMELIQSSQSIFERHHCPVTQCQISLDRNDFKEADLVIFQVILANINPN